MNIYEDRFLFTYCLVMAAIVGALFGSFLNCAAFRISRKQNFVSDRSKCPVCHHVLSPLDLVPIFSWVFLGGKCRYCKTKVSPRYVLTELAFTAITVLTFLADGISFFFLRDMILAMCLFVLTLVDIEIMEIPDGCIIISAAAWLVVWFITRRGSLAVHLGTAAGMFVGILVLSLIMDKILGKDSLGGGDIKLFMIMGLYLGPIKLMFALIISSIAGLITAFADKRFHPDREGYFPFGPAIALSIWIMQLYGDSLAGWYLNMIGMSVQ